MHALQGTYTAVSEQDILLPNPGLHFHSVNEQLCLD